MSNSTTEPLLEAHRLIRKKHASKKGEELDKLKGEGNRYFNEGEYFDAANYYVHAINIYGPKPVLLSNLAAAYLKLELYEEALWAATTALEFDPKMAKARYRRAMARKNLSFYKGALKDMETVVAATPTDEIVKELETVRKLAESSEGKDHGKKEKDIIYPSQDSEAWEVYDDSDTEDSKHIGNTVSCRFYNHQGCRRAKDCDFSHMPDNKSVRDELGKNVCLDYLFDECRFGDSKCIYSHDKTYLPEHGWWKDKAKIRAAKRFRQELGMDVTFAGYDIVHKFLRANPKANGYAARDFRQAITEYLNLLHETALEKVESRDTPNASGSKDRFVLIIALDLLDMFTSIYSDLLNGLRSRVKVIEISTSQEASQKASEYFDSPNLAGVLVSDPALLETKHKKLLDKLVRYVKNGGSAVFGGNFSSFIAPPKFDSFMKKVWGLDWKFGSYHRTTFQVNPGNELVNRNPSLAQSYSMKSVHVKGIQPQHAIYVPVDDAHLESCVFPPVKITDKTESPAVCARIEKGLFSFLGSVNAETDSTKTVLAMLGLLDASNDLQPPEITSAVLLNASDKGKGKEKETSSQSSQANGAASSQNKVKESELVPKSGFVLILALSNRDMFERIYDDQLSALRKRVDIKFAETSGRALEYLGSPDIRGALIADDGIAKSSNSPALLKVVEYAKNGGLVLIGGLFPSLSDKADISRTFKLFDVPWQQGSYTRCEAQLNRDHEVAKVNPGKLRNTTTLKAVLVSGYDEEDVLYKQTQRDAPKEVPIVRRTIGKGRVGYIGDVNAETGFTPVVLAIFDLLKENAKKDLKLHPDSQKFFMVLTPDPVDESGPSTSGFLKDARQRAEVLCGLSNARVIDLLSSSDLLGVLVPNSYILQARNAYLLSKLVAYVREGGTVVFGLAFAQQVKPDQFNPFFRENWGLDWSILDDSINTVVYQNPQGPLVGKSKLPGDFWLESMYVKVPTQTTPVYFTARPARLWNASEKNFNAPVLFGDVGKGHVGFIGASHMDGEVRSVFYAMMELL